MRRDRLLLISAFATALLTLLGAVGVRIPVIVNGQSGRS
jgi:hypothetical protein